ncbi:MAG: anti-sigma factor domain-containing protein [Geminicoccaceae bacterium]
MKHALAETIRSSEDELASLFAKTTAVVYATVLKILDDDAKASAVLCDGYFDLWHQRLLPAGSDEDQAFACVIAYFRRRALARVHADEDQEGGEVAVGHASRASAEEPWLVGVAQQAFPTLSGRAATLMDLAYVDGLPLSQIAKRQGLSKAQARVELHKALSLILQENQERRGEIEEVELLAGEYALGTLRGPARSEFEDAMTNVQSLRGAVAAWEKRFGALAQRLPSTRPGTHIWHEIQRRRKVALGGGANQAQIDREMVQLRRAARGWRLLAFAGVGLALLSVGLYQATSGVGDARAETTTASRPPAAVAVLRGQIEQPAWHVVLDGKAGKLVLTPVHSPAVEANRTLKLWAITGSQARPILIGRVDTLSTVKLELPDTLRAAMPAAIQLVVTAEPKWGAKKAFPTGEAVLTGELIAG